MRSKKEKDETTPRPWKVYLSNELRAGKPQELVPESFENDDRGNILLAPLVAVCKKDGETGYEFSVENSANAALIARAVNSYDELIALCKEFKLFLQRPTSDESSRAKTLRRLTVVLAQVSA